MSFKKKILGVQANLSNTYCMLGRFEDSLTLSRGAYSSYVKLYGEENEQSLDAANKYAWDLIGLRRFEEAKALMRKTMPVAQRVLGENHEDTLRLRWTYADAIWRDDAATLDDLLDAAETLEEAARTARRVLGGEHPFVEQIEGSLQGSQAAYDARHRRDA